MQKIPYKEYLIFLKTVRTLENEKDKLSLQNKFHVKKIALLDAEIKEILSSLHREQSLRLVRGGLWK